VLPQQLARRVAHRIDIEPARDVPREPALKRAHDARVADPVAIHFRPRREPCVEARRRDVDRQHADILWQLGVERAVKVVLGDGIRKLEACDLSKRVHARIRPSRARDGDVLPFDGCQSELELSLHRARIRLPLETGEIGAVVTDGDFERTHITSCQVPVPGSRFVVAPQFPRAS
jgi:hypothetical protein